MMVLADNLKYVNERIDAVCVRSGRTRSEVSLLAVTKTVAPEKIREAAAIGLTLVGENRVQEAWTKFQHLSDVPATWHLIGHLQTNKVKRALDFFDLIESVDSIHLACEINRIASTMKRIIPVFMEINTSGEPSKFGVPPEQSEELASSIVKLDHLRLTGLMTIGVFSQDKSRIRHCFSTLRTIRADLLSLGYKIDHLSMGMSEDFEIAIEEGATIIRLGRALFGERI